MGFTSGLYQTQKSTENNTERADTRAFTSWPLGVAAFKLFVFSQPSISRDKGLIKLDKGLESTAATPNGQGVNPPVSPLSACTELFACIMSASKSRDLQALQTARC